MAFTSGRIAGTSWSDLSTSATKRGKLDGQPGYVPLTDVGTHDGYYVETSGVVAWGTGIPNWGEYVWIASVSAFARPVASTFSRFSLSLIEQPDAAGARNMLNVPSVGALVAEESARLARDSELQASIAGESAAALALPYSRPGDSPSRFTPSLTGGDPAELPAYSVDDVVEDDNGRVIRIAGSGVVGQRGIFAIEQGRTYLARAVVRRRVNTNDPANDAVRVALTWYDQNRERLPSPLVTSIQTLTDLTVSSGRRTVSSLVSFTPGDSVIAAPANARYARIFVQTFGTVAQTDVEVVYWADVTDASVFAPDVSAFDARLGALESDDLDPRLTALEAAVTAPDALRLELADDIDGQNVPVSVNAIYVSGKRAVGDGDPALYKRGPQPTHAGKKQSADGSWWELAGDGPIHAAYFDIDGSGSDQTAKYQAAFSTAAALNRELVMPAIGTISVDRATITAPGKKISVKRGMLKSLATAGGVAVSIEGAKVGETTMTANVAASSRFITVADASAIEAGYLVGLISTKAWYHDPRAPVGLTGLNTGTSTGGGTSTIVLDPVLTGVSVDLTGMRITILSGANKGISRTITSWNAGTLTATLDRAAPASLSGVQYLIPQAFKGELHEVVRKVGNVLELRHPLGDGYHVADILANDRREAVAVHIINPVEVDVEGGEYDWAKNSGVSNFQMLRLKYAKNSFVRRSVLRNVRRTGIQIERSYNCRVEDPIVYGADGTYTGYGVQYQCSSFCWTSHGRFWGCRRAIDVHSTYDWVDPWPSWFCGGDENVAFGGGQRQDGENWSAKGTTSSSEDDGTEQYGFGEHGPAAGTTWVNCQAHNIHGAFLMRGRNTRNINPLVVGRCDIMFKVWYGGDHEIVSPKYRSSVIVGDEALSEYFGEYRNFDSFPGSDFRSNLPLRMLEITGSNVFAQFRKGRVRIQDPDVVVREAAIYHANAGALELADIEVDGGRVEIWAVSDTDEVFFFNANHSGALKRFRINTDVIVRNGVYLPFRWQNTIEQSSSRIRLGYDPSWSAAYTTTDASPLTAGINETSAASSQGTEIMRTSAATTRFRGEKVRIEVSVPISRTDASGSRAIVYLFRQVAATITLLRAVFVDTAGQDKKHMVSFVHEDDPATHLPIEYFVKAGPRSGETGGIRINGSSAGAALAGGAGKEIASLVARAA
nr:hypothetical protein [uncultured Shinella sp.]